MNVFEQEALSSMQVVLLLSIVNGIGAALIGPFLYAGSYFIAHYFLDLFFTIRIRFASIGAVVWSWGSIFRNLSYRSFGSRDLEPMLTNKNAMAAKRANSDAFTQPRSLAIIIPGTWSGDGYDWHRWKEVIGALRSVDFDVYGCKWYAQNSEIGRMKTAEQLASLIQQKHATASFEKTVLIGHSFGGQIAYRVAQISPVSLTIGIATPHMVVCRRSTWDGLGLLLGFFLRLGLVSLLITALLLLLPKQFQAIDSYWWYPTDFFKCLITAIFLVVIRVALSMEWRESNIRSIFDYAERFQQPTGPVVAINCMGDSVVDLFRRSRLTYRRSEFRAGKAIIAPGGLKLRWVIGLLLPWSIVAIGLIFSAHVAAMYVEPMRSVLKSIWSVSPDYQFLVFGLFTTPAAILAAWLLGKVRKDSGFAAKIADLSSFMRADLVRHDGIATAMANLLGWPSWSRFSFKYEFRRFPVSAKHLRIRVDLSFIWELLAKVLPVRHSELIQDEALARIVSRECTRTY